MESRLLTRLAAIKSFGYTTSLICTCLLVLVVLWLSPASFLSYSQLSVSEIQTVFGSPAVSGRVKTNFYSVSGPHEASRSTAGEAEGALGDQILSEFEVQRHPEELVIASNSSSSNTSAPSFVSTGPPLSEFNSSSSSELEARVPSNEGKEAFSINNSTQVETDGPVEKGNSTQPVVIVPGGNGTVVKEGSFADADDSQLLDLAEISEPPSRQKTGSPEKYIMPALSFYVGTGNQLIEYKSAMVIARTLNRTLCLSPFFIGPGRHFGYLGDWHFGLSMEERYSMESLSEFVKVASIPECIQACEGRLDVHWQLRRMSKAPAWNMWFNDTPRMSFDFDRNSPKWSKPRDVAQFLGPHNDAKCVGLGGLFPGLRWKGVFYAASAYLEHSQGVNGAADHLLTRALMGNVNQSFVGVHWRFEESRCSGHPLGLCFARCGDGSVIANGRRSETWETMTLEGKKLGNQAGFHGVFVSKEDISGAIYDKARDFGSMNVYLATDGWIRGNESRNIVKWVVEDLRSKNVNVAGLWQVWGLPNFADGSYVVSQNMAEVFGMPPKQKVSNHIIAMVEQQVCERSTAFIGSGQSSWSLAVADARQGRECKRAFSKQTREKHPGMSESQLNNEVIDQILDIQYTPWPTCRGSKNNTNIPSDVEVNDGWLDYDACEARLVKHVGNCRRIQT